MRTISIRLRWLSLAALVATAGACSDTEPQRPDGASDDGAYTVDPELTRSTDRTQLTFDFEGGWTPEGGLWVGRVSRSGAERHDASGLVTVAQAGYCEVDADNDGTPGSGAPDTVELVTTNYFAFAPFAWLPGGGCDVPTNAVASASAGSFGPDGVSCGDVTIRSFYSVPLSNVHAQITEFGGNGYHLAFPSAPVPTGMAPGAAALGLWSYGDIAASGGAATDTWYFRNGDETAFNFRGIVVVDVAELCGNGIDDDCDGIADEGCGVFPLAAACAEDIDCATGFCDASGRCGAPTCPNGVIDGSETDVDCGGTAACPTCTLGQLCGADTDCDSSACNEVSTTESRCRATRNPAAGELVVTEFLANTGGDDSVNNYVGEWFELYNTTAEDLSLEGCRAYDDGGDSERLFGDEFIVGAGEYHVFARGPVPAYLSSAVPAGRLHVVNGVVLGNGGDEIRIECGTTQIDAFTYDDGDIDQTAEGVASQLHAPVIAGAGIASANDDRREYCASTDLYGNDGTVDYFGTPGAANNACAEFAPSFCRFQFPTARPTQVGGGLTLTVFGRVFAAGYTDVTAGFNDAQPTRFVAQAGYGALGADPTAPGAFTWSTMAPNGAYDCSACGGPEDNNDEFTATLIVPNTVGTTYDLAMRFSGDNGATWTVCDTGNGSADGYLPADAAQLQVITPPLTPTVRGDVIITEAFINLPGGTETGEFIELFNTTGDNLELQGCVLSDNDGNPFTIASSYVLAAGDYVVIGAPAAFSAGWADLEYVAMSLSNSGDPFDFSCGGTTIDEWVYTTDLDASGFTQQLDISAYDADLNDLDVTFGGRDIKTWWCNTPLTAANTFGQWFDDGLLADVDVYGTPGAANDSCLAIDYCRLDNPLSLVEVATGSTHTIEGQFYSEGTTDQSTGNESHHMLRFEFGQGTDGSADPGADFSWASATAIGGWDGSAVSEPNNDGYEATLTAPALASTSQDYAFRVSGDNGTTWTYCDGVAGGSDGSLDGYQAANAGQLSTPQNWTIASCSLNWPTPTIDASPCGRSGDVAAGDACSVYGAVNVPGLTDVSGGVDASGSLVVEVGYGVSGTASTGWTDWTAAAGNVGLGGGADEYAGLISVPTAASPGPAYDYGVRASGDGGATWTYCTGAGDMDVVAYDAEYGIFETGTTYAAANEGAALAVTARSWHGFTVTWPYGPVTPVPSDVRAQAGIAANGAADPCSDDSAWTFVDATLTGLAGNDYQWTASITTPAPGSYDTLWRFSGDGGATWLCADTAGVGSTNRGSVNSIALQAGDLVVTEIIQNPTAIADATGEWFEVYNATAAALNVNGLVVSDLGSDSFTVTSDVVIPSGGYATFATSAGALGGPAPDYVYGSSWFLSNSDDEIILTFGGIEIDRVTYDGGPVFPDPGAASMQLINPVLDNNAGGNWCTASVGTFGAGDFGTPGAANDCDTSLSAGTLIITEIMYDSAHATDQEWVELYNTTSTAIDLSIYGPLTLSDSGANTVSFTTGVIPANSYVVFGNDTITDFAPDFTYAQSSMTLGNGGDAVFVVLGGTAQDNVDYSAASFHDPSGRSLNLDVDLYGSDRTDGANWCSGLTTYDAVPNYGTPGSANNDCAEACTGGADDDLDGETDCSDAACAGDAACGGGPTPTECLIFSEYIEGATADGSSKALELYNCGTTDWDFSTTSVRVCVVANAATTCTSGIALTGTLVAGDVLTVCAATTTGLPAGNCDILSGSISHNGDDRAVVYVDAGGGTGYDAGTDTLLDAFGETASRPGSSTWKDMSLRRTDCTPYDGVSGTQNSGAGTGFGGYWTSVALGPDLSNWGLAPSCL